MSDNLKATVNVGRWQVRVYQHVSGGFFADVFNRDQAVWVGSTSRDSYEEVLVEAGTVIAAQVRRDRVDS